MNVLSKDLNLAVTNDKRRTNGSVGACMPAGTGDPGLNPAEPRVWRLYVQRLPHLESASAEIHVRVINNPTFFFFKLKSQNY